MKEELPTRYEPGAFEQKIYAFWERGGYFTPINDRERPKFSIVIPPPNVTGRLHVGHALVNTLQDVVVRWKRMSGFNTLWMPGTDHAGIATQMMVDRELTKEGKSRFDLGREKFLERAWQFKEQNATVIKDQLTRLGASADWSRERFTLDAGLSRAVRHVFVSLYRDGLIYRDIAMVNWCPQCRTAISDIEVEYRERNAKLYEIDYPVDGSDRRLRVATTRPETMLGDTALAVHPNDERYRDLIGAQVTVPVANRRIPVVADSILVDPEFGTGVVKVTPAHDKNDYEAGLRHQLPQLQVIDEGGKMTSAAGELFAGLDRFAARKKVLEELQSGGVLANVKDYVHSVGVHGKCDTDIEPMISRQWFVRIEPLAKPAIDAVRSHAVEIIPQSWEATYFNWMENIRDWTISRQLWWGHRIPAFYCSNGHTTVSEEDLTSCPECGSQKIEQDPDVLDTWFSSALWPFSTMGWPDKTPDYETFYPTDLLITGFDILFFWVARMIMMGLRFTGRNPFTQVYIHGLVRDEKGEKMSKTKGNVIDPLDVINEVGADALRFTLAINNTGRDIPLGKTAIASYSAFVNKIWNASRFAMMHLDIELKSAKPIERESLGTVERWILSRLNDATKGVNRNLSMYRFDEAAGTLHHFFWHEFCDWYIEMVKPVLLGRQGTDRQREQAKRVLLEVLDRSLRLLHPFMPFVTEEIWQAMPHVGETITTSPWPKAKKAWFDTAAEEQVSFLQEVVVAIRNMRSEMNLPPAKTVSAVIKADGEGLSILENNRAILGPLARVGEWTLGPAVQRPGVAASAIVRGVEVWVPLAGLIDVEAERARLTRELDKALGDLEGTKKKLMNQDFLGKARADVVQREKDRLELLDQTVGKLRKALEALRG
jgi:valyl-tRNA synthetase